MRASRSDARVAALMVVAALVGLFMTGLPEQAAARKKAAKPGDPYARTQWNLDAIDGRKPLNLFRRPGPEVQLAQIDTGVALQNPDLAPRLWRSQGEVPGPVPRGGSSALLYPPQGPVPLGSPGWDTIGTDIGPYVSPDPFPEDSGGHGTPVASIAAAATGNGIGIAGVAPNARLMEVRSCWTNQVDCYDELTAASIRWAADNGARVFNLSLVLFGGHQQIENAIVANPQALFITVAGNNAGADLDGSTDLYPCELPEANVICVAASARGGAVGSCTNLGARSVDVAAPGEGITVALQDGRFQPNSGCATSFAVPHVSGLAALLFGAVPEATAPQVKAAVLDGVTPAPAFAGRVATGGIIDVRRSLDLLQDRFGIPRPPRTRLSDLEVMGRRVTARLGARGTKPTGFECALDRQQFRRCKRVISFTGLDRGKHALRARALGPLGTVDPTPVRRAFAVARRAAR